MFTILKIVIVFAGIIYLWHRVGYYADKKAWNNGVCPVCNKGFWKSFDVDSGGGVGYKCTNCENSHWQNGHFNTHPKVRI
jgi:hypothetical protein